jgi:hypothetical protein
MGFKWPVLFCPPVQQQPFLPSFLPSFTMALIYDTIFSDATDLFEELLALCGDEECLEVFAVHPIPGASIQDFFQ